jgi:hypothetical protein
MKITISQITQTVIEIDFPDNQEDTVQKPSPRKPFSFFDLICREAERTMKQELLEDKFNGSFLAQ